jgi:hypothetical protein
LPLNRGMRIHVIGRDVANLATAESGKTRTRREQILNKN